MAKYELLKWREENNISRPRLGQLLGCSPSAIEALEVGRNRYPSLPIAFALERVTKRRIRARHWLNQN